MKSPTPPDLPVSPDSLRHVRETERPPRVTAAKRTSTSPALNDAVGQLHAGRANALEQFSAGAELIATGLREYGRLWQHAVQVSRAIGDNDTGGNTAALGGPLRHHSRLHPKELKAALARVLTSAGVDLLDTPTRLGAKRRGRR